MKNNFELVHVGINTPNADEALKLAELSFSFFQKAVTAENRQ